VYVFDTTGNLVFEARSLSSAAEWFGITTVTVRKYLRKIMLTIINIFYLSQMYFLA
jgi:hypothetical protein